MRLDGKVALITGAGSGMGRVASLLFAREGAKVVSTDVDEAAGRETEAMARAEGLDVRFFKADVSKEADCRAMVAFAEETFGKLNVLYNNAGIFPEADHSVVDTDEAVWDRVLAVNVKGVYLACKHGIPAMHAGETTYLIKSRLGCRLHRSWIYYRHRSPMLNRVFRASSRWVAFDTSDPDLKRLGSDAPYASAG